MAKSIFDLVDELDKHVPHIYYVWRVLLLTAETAFLITTITRISTTSI